MAAALRGAGVKNGEEGDDGCGGVRGACGVAGVRCLSLGLAGNCSWATLALRGGVGATCWSAACEQGTWGKGSGTTSRNFPGGAFIKASSPRGARAKGTAGDTIP